MISPVIMIFCHSVCLCELYTRILFLFWSILESCYVLVSFFQYPNFFDLLFSLFYKGFTLFFISALTAPLMSALNNTIFYLNFFLSLIMSLNPLIFVGNKRSNVFKLKAADLLKYALSGLRLFLTSESTLKMMKTAFYVTLLFNAWW